MTLQNTITGATCVALFADPPAPGSGGPVLLIEHDAGDEVCSMEQARGFRVLECTDGERRTAIARGYHFARF